MNSEQDRIAGKLLAPILIKAVKLIRQIWNDEYTTEYAENTILEIKQALEELPDRD
jgi:hypothetical protein